MDEEIETLLVGVRADTRGFARDVADMRGGLESGLGNGAERAGRSIEGALAKAARSGRIGFDDLRATALRVLGDIAAAAIQSGFGALGIGGGAGGGLGSVLGALLSGLPGRATGGPVSPSRPYLVGERGPELFVPTASGQVTPVHAAGPREVRVAITVHAGAEAAPRALAQSSRQVARAVRAALAQAE